MRATKTTGRQGWQFMLVNTLPDGDSIQQKGAFTGTVLLEEWFGGGTGKYMHVRAGVAQNRRELMEKLMSQVYTCHTVEVKAYVNGVLNKTHYKFVCDYVDNESFPDPLEEWGSPSNGGGSGNNNAPANIIFDIRDSLDNYPCAKALVVQLVLLDNDIATVIKNIFGNSKTFNATFVSSSTLDDNVDGVEAGYGVSIQYSPTGEATYNSTIKLNSFILENSTQEYILVTMYHEILHSFLRAEQNRLGNTAFFNQYPEASEYEYTYGNGKKTKKYDIDQNHTRFAIYVNALTDAILSFNSNMPIASARAMAKMGIVQGSSLSNTEKLLNGYERDVSTGDSKGTRCPE